MEIAEWKKSLPWDNCVFRDLVSCVKAEPTALLWERVPLFDASVPKDVKEPPALRFFLNDKKINYDFNRHIRTGNLSKLLLTLMKVETAMYYPYSNHNF